MVKEEKVDDFIGQRFGEGGHLEVISWKGERSGGDKIYAVKCHECARDTELFGDGVFKCNRYNLVNGRIPCGCARRVNWSQEQQMVRVERACAKNNIKFLGIVGAYTANESKLHLVCLEDGNEWQTQLSCLVSGFGRCSVCGHKRSAKSATKQDHVMIESFTKSGAFLPGVTFWRSDRLNHINCKPYWKYTCPSCSNDEYVQNGLCSGVFESHSASLQQGQLSCRCSKNYQWTKEQREYQILKIIDEDSLNYSFLGFADGFKSNKTKLKFLCRTHSKEFFVSITSFIYAGSRCAACAKSGFDPSKPASLYVLQAEGRTGEFTGYGITGNLQKRLRTHIRNLSKMGYSITDCRVFAGTGQVILDKEREIKDNFICVAQDVAGFKTEATEHVLFKSVCDFLQEETMIRETNYTHSCRCQE